MSSNSMLPSKNQSKINQYDSHSSNQTAKSTISSKTHKLTVYQLQWAIPLLEQAVDRLRVVYNSYETKPSSVKESNKFDPLPLKLEERFSDEVYKADGIFYRETGEPYEDAVERLKFDKLRMDKNYIEHVLSLSCAELKMGGTFNQFETIVKTESELLQDDTDFIREYVQNKLLLDKLKLALNKVTEKANKHVFHNKQLDHYQMTNAARTRYIKNWESARQNQQISLCNAKEEQYKSEIRMYQSKIDFETRCRSESEMHLMMTMDGWRNEIEKWMVKFDDDYEAVEVDTQVAVERLEETRKRNADMHQLYDDRQSKMDAYQKMVRDAAEFEANKIKYEINAVILQAWWRGTMVRRCLGPYKKKKKKGKGKKKK